MPLKVPAGADEADYDLTVSWKDGTATRLPSAEGSYRTAVRSAPGIVARADDSTDRSLPTAPVAGSFPISADFDASVPAVVIPSQAEGDSSSTGGFCVTGPGEAVFADTASGRLLVHGVSGVSVIPLPDAVRGATDFVVDPTLSTGCALYDDRVEEYAIHDGGIELRTTVGLASPLVPGSAAVVAGALVARTSPTTIERVLGSGAQAAPGDLAAIDAISGAPVVVRFHDGASPRIYDLDEVLRDVGGGSVFQGGAARVRPDGQIETLLSFAEEDRVVWAYAAIRDDGEVTRLASLGPVWAPVSGDPFRVCGDRLAMARVSDDGTRVEVVDFTEVG